MGDSQVMEGFRVMEDIQDTAGTRAMGDIRDMAATRGMEDIRDTEGIQGTTMDMDITITMGMKDILVVTATGLRSRKPQYWRPVECQWSTTEKTTVSVMDIQPSFPWRQSLNVIYWHYKKKA
ncbi:hypothetical protein DRW41_01890 [Neobacillus piezotolerans]|uniref:Uncharacterized protein n=1 Tax=Neobacillus piezotolerans TaxID=2259171 RepID=A0A3D8GVF2_9BACI|nr:hypothetical protein DRW41_01890 [Neobacillus piezotolerans]